MTLQPVQRAYSLRMRLLALSILLFLCSPMHGIADEPDRVAAERDAAAAELQNANGRQTQESQHNDQQGLMRQLEELLPAGTSVQQLGLKELQQRLVDGDYVPLSGEHLRRWKTESQRPAVERLPFRRPQIRNARYSAELRGRRLATGEILLDVYEPDAENITSPLELGRTNLTGLVFHQSDRLLEIGSDAQRRLFVLNPDRSLALNGTWTADGVVTGDSVSFRLEIPEATVSSFELTTDPGVTVSGVNCLVVGPKAASGRIRWILMPTAPGRLSFVCRTQRGLQAGQPVAFPGAVAQHTATTELMSSRWTLTLPPELTAGTELTFSLPAFVRISDVSLNQGIHVPWHADNQASPAGSAGADAAGAGEAEELQHIRISLPQLLAGTTLEINGISILPQDNQWPLPMLTPLAWLVKRASDPAADEPAVSSGEVATETLVAPTGPLAAEGVQVSSSDATGPLLFPMEQISLSIPGTVRFSRWSMSGVQEQDVVVGADGTRILKLSRFSPQARAVAQISEVRTRLTDSLAL
ncbi:MAG: hypothetical protein KDA96_17360, partial [Planctomycetaceae bacterium]|nr:hypothetical protein [Planctomycetaceae bacterium]